MSHPGFSIDMNLPVLIYIAKDPCPACTAYNPEWEKIKRELDGKARFVKIICNAQTPHPPPCLAKYAHWFPSIVLVGPKSYFRCFTPDDKINREDWVEGYIIKGKKFNALEDRGVYQYAGRPNTAENTLMWFNQVVGIIPQIDELTPPRKFVSMFNR